MRTILATVPNGVILATAAGFAMLMTIVGMWVLRRFVGRVHTAERSEFSRLLVSMMGSLYGLILGFVIIAAWNNLGQAFTATSHEATSFATIIRSSGLMSKEDQTILAEAVGKYVIAVRIDEWPNMREGKGRAQSAYDAMTGVYTAAGQLHPVGPIQIAAYQSIVNTTNQAFAARRVRLDRAEQHLPEGLVALLLIGVFVIEGFIILMVSNANRVERGMAVLANGLIGLTLALALLLDYPFSGQLGVNDSVWTVGALAQYNQQVEAARIAAGAR